MTNGNHRTSDPQNDEPQDNKQKGEWIAVEHKNTEGEPIIPEHLIRSTWMVKYKDREKNTAPGIIILQGYNPKPIVLVSNKIYQADKFGIAGWRRKADVRIEIEPQRPHEEEWFKEMDGMPVQVRNPGTPGTISDEYSMEVIETGFTRKINEVFDETGQNKKILSFEGKLILRETLRSVWRRERIEFFRKSTTFVVTAIVSAAITAIVTLWVAT